MVFLHRLRWPLLMGVVAIHLLAHWFVVVDVLLYHPTVKRAVEMLKERTGLWLALDRSVRGVLGVSPGNGPAADLLLGLAFAAFHGAALLAIGPARDWPRRMAQEPGGRRATAAVGAFMAAVVTTAAVVALADIGGLWPLLGRVGRDLWAHGLWGDPPHLTAQFPIGMGILLLAWLLWWRRLRRSRAPDRFWQLAGTVYHLFVFAGVVLLATGLVHVSEVGFEAYHWLRGTYAGAVLSGVVMLWSLIPGMAVIFAAESYWRWAHRQCLRCGYDLRPSIVSGARQCPECGAEIPEQL
jgi:hypothetical protein